MQVNECKRHVRRGRKLRTQHDAAQNANVRDARLHGRKLINGYSNRLYRWADRPFTCMAPVAPQKYSAHDLRLVLHICVDTVKINIFESCDHNIILEKLFEKFRED